MLDRYNSEIAISNMINCIPYPMTYRALIGYINMNKNSFSIDHNRTKCDEKVNTPV